MKKVLLLLIYVSTFAPAFASEDPIADSKKLGLVAFLTYVKQIGEAKMIILASHANYKDSKFADKVKTFNSTYNMLKVSIDKLINQASADLFASNRLKLYKSLDAYLKEGKALPGKFDQYKPLIDEIDGLFQSLMIKTYSSTLGGATLEELTAIAELGHTVITDARDFREKKIQSIAGLLKELRMASISELVKPKDKE